MMYLKYTIEFRVTMCPCVYVNTIMFMKAKSKNGQSLHNLKREK